MKSLATWKLISASLEQQIPVMLLYVVDSSGSSPGRRGFCMAVNARSQMEGSVGGGIMEHKLVELAKARIHNGVTEASVYRQVHNKSEPANQSGMICSGEQTIALYSLKKEDALIVREIVGSLELDKKGMLRLSPAGIQFNSLAIPGKTVYQAASPDNWNYQEMIGSQHHLYIIGAGHCALAVSRIFQPMDFYIHLYDDRSGLKTMEENNYVHEKTVLSNYEEIQTLVEPGPGTYVVIMTVGYRTDTIALKALVNLDLKYLGLLGSSAKSAKLLEDLRNAGYKDQVLQKVHTPIGLPINSQTPEEVAISIAAEIIRVKNFKP